MGKATLFIVVRINGQRQCDGMSYTNQLSFNLSNDLKLDFSVWIKVQPQTLV